MVSGITYEEDLDIQAAVGYISDETGRIAYVFREFQRGKYLKIHIIFRNLEAFIDYREMVREYLKEKFRTTLILTAIAT